jgi:hypothetical protein
MIVSSTIQYIERETPLDVSDPLAVVRVLRIASLEANRLGAAYPSIDDYDAYFLGDLASLIGADATAQSLHEIGRKCLLPAPSGTAFIQFVPSRAIVATCFAKHPPGMERPGCFDITLVSCPIFVPLMEAAVVRVRDNQISGNLTEVSAISIYSDLLTILALLNTTAGYRYVDNEPERRDATPSNVVGADAVHASKPIRIVYVNRETVIRPQYRKTDLEPAGRKMPPHDRHYQKRSYERTWMDKTGQLRTVTCHRHKMVAEVNGGAKAGQLKPINVVRLANPILPAV